jgi:glycosyltransferase involved in cell wall biosynthesis
MTFNDPNPNVFLCVYVGRISREKRLDILIDAVKDIEDIYLAIVGTIDADVMRASCFYVPFS